MKKGQADSMPGSSRRPGGLKNISTSSPHPNWGRRVSSLVLTTTVLARWGSTCQHMPPVNHACSVLGVLACLSELMGHRMEALAGAHLPWTFTDLNCLEASCRGPVHQHMDLCCSGIGLLGRMGCFLDPEMAAAGPTCQHTPLQYREDQCLSGRQAQQPRGGLWCTWQGGLAAHAQCQQPGLVAGVKLSGHGTRSRSLTAEQEMQDSEAGASYLLRHTASCCMGMQQLTVLLYTITYDVPPLIGPASSDKNLESSVSSQAYTARPQPPHLSLPDPLQPSISATI